MVIWSTGVAPRWVSLPRVVLCALCLMEGVVLHCSIIHTSTSYAIKFTYREFTREVSLQKNGNGQIVVDSHLRALGDASGRVYGLGECAQVEGHSLPLHSVLSLLCDPVSCGQVAELHLAKALCHCATSKSPCARPVCVQTTACWPMWEATSLCMIHCTQSVKGNSHHYNN